jgi:hypothetical protein
MTKRRLCEELSDVEFSPEMEAKVRYVTEVADRDGAEARRRQHDPELSPEWWPARGRPTNPPGWCAAHY